MQRDAKLVSYEVVDKASKPHVAVDVAGQNKVTNPQWQAWTQPKFEAVTLCSSLCLHSLLVPAQTPLLLKVCT